MKEKITFFLLAKNKQKQENYNIFKYFKGIAVFILFLIVICSGFFLVERDGYRVNKKMASSNLDRDIKANELVIKFKSNDEIYKFKFDSSANITQIIKSYQQNLNIDFIEPNVIYRETILPTDTFYSNQWYLKKIKVPEAWNIVRESPNVVVAVIDSGVQINHIDLKDNIWFNKKEIANNNIDDDKNGFIDDINGWDFVNNSSDPNPKFIKGYKKDEILHGTIVAGIIAAAGNNATGISGVTWRAKIMPLKVLSDDGKGDTFSVTKAIDYAINNKADIINLSFVTSHYSRAMEKAIKRAYDAGIIVVAAAGNDQSGGGIDLDLTPMYPVCYDGSNGENMVIGVAATDGLDQKASFSGYGKKCVDISAPGVSVFSTVVYAPQNYYNNSPFDKNYDGYWSGTSMAVPMVSGSLALIEGLNPSLNRDGVTSVLINSSDNISKLNPNFIGKLGRGRLNVHEALIVAQAQLISYNYNLAITPKNNSTGNVTVSDRTGNLIKQFLAYDKNFRGGVNVAAGDIDGDGKDEVVTGTGAGGGPQVKIFDRNAVMKSSFFAYDKNFRGGVNVAVADVDGGARNKKKEIITSPGPGGGPQIVIFNNYAQRINQFFAYDKKFRSGVSIYGGDIDNDGLDEIVTGAGPGGAPHVRVFKKDGKLIYSFYSLNKDFTGGINVAAIKY